MGDILINGDEFWKTSLDALEAETAFCLVQYHTNSALSGFEHFVLSDLRLSELRTGYLRLHLLHGYCWGSVSTTYSDRATGLSLFVFVCLFVFLDVHDSVFKPFYGYSFILLHTYLCCVCGCVCAFNSLYLHSSITTFSSC